MMPKEKKEKKEASKVMTPTFRVSFAHVFEPHKFESDGAEKEPKFSVIMLFDDKADLKPMKAIAQQAAVDFWGEDKIPKKLRSPFRDGAEKPDLEGYEGMIFVNAWSYDRPGVVDQKVQPITDRSEFYSGCYARATVTAFAYEHSGNPGVAFGLMNVQKVKDGEPFSGRSKPEDDFEPLEADDAGGEPAAADDVSDLF